MAIIVWVIILFVVFRVIVSASSGRSNRNRQNTPEARLQSSARPQTSARTQAYVQQHNYRQTQRTAAKQFNQREFTPAHQFSQHRGSEAGHLCEDGTHSEEVAPTNSFRNTGGKDDLTAMVDEINNNKAENELAFKAMRVRRITPEEYQDKRQELKALMDNGIISVEEYKSIIKEYSYYVTR